MEPAAYSAIYDFELLPYALGDVLTFNIQSAMYAEEAGRSKVDIYICMDTRYPASIYQRGLVVAENSSLYLNELFGAFGTHPMLGNIFLFGSRDDLLARLRDVAQGDAVTAAGLADYERVLSYRENEAELNKYFIKYIYSHARLNRFAAMYGRIPLLVASRGCEPDVQGVMNNVLGDKRVVVIHPRLRRLDFGLAGEHTYARDSDFLEWYEFVRAAGEKHPDVQFVVVGRLQEKPVELLRLPNVISLRALGLGLGHELTMMLDADFFLGTSSGFAAMANFSKLPYFITHMNKESCNAYDIPSGSPRLPFATSDQWLIYERETAAMLGGLLERGLALPRRARAPAQSRIAAIDVESYPQERARRLPPAATTGRYFVDDAQADQETAFLVSPNLRQAYAALGEQDPQMAAGIARRISTTFPRLHARMPELSQLLAGTAEPPPPPTLGERIRQFLEGINAHVLPLSLRGGRVHHAARRIKRRLLSR